MSTYVRSLMNSYEVGLDFKCLVWAFSYFHNVDMMPVHTLQRLLGCTYISEPLLVIILSDCHFITPCCFTVADNLK